jgi:hypothetical protein
MKFPTIKLTPLRIFLLILLVLLVSVVFGKQLQSYTRHEGMIDFYLKTPPLTQVVVPQYNSRKLFLIYNSIFYDPMNGNIVDVTSSTTGPAETYGNSITKFTVINRTNGTKPYDNFNGYMSQNVAESQSTTMQSISDCYTRKAMGDSTLKIQYFYIPWDTDTYMHFVDVTGKKHPITAFIGFKNSGVTSSTNDNTDNSFNAFYTQTSPKAYAPNGEENKMMKESSGIYNTARSVYVVSKNVLYDPDTGNLLLRNYDANGSVADIKVYDRSFATSSSTVLNPPPSNTYTSAIKYSDPSPLPAIVPSKGGLVSMIVYTDDNANMVLYIANSLKSIIAVFRVSASDKDFMIQNVARFDQFGAFTKGVSTTGTPLPDADTTTDNTKSGSNTANAGHKFTDVNSIWKSLGADQNSNDIMRQFFNYYYNTDGTNIGTPFSTDYLLKTSVVPPVCPMCPMCPANTSGSVCTNCGGNGGSGTKGTAGGNTTATNASVSDDRNRAPPSGHGGPPSGHDEPDGPGVTQLLENAGSGATNLVKGAGSGAVDLAKSAGSGATDLVKSAGGGAVGLVKDAGSGVAGLFATHPTSVSGANAGGSAQAGQGQGGQSQGANGQMKSMPAGSDPYSYYGALPSKSSGNFIPITSDFSAFGR